MKKFSAHYVFPVSTLPIKNGIVVTDDSGKIVEVINPNNDFKEIAGLEFHNGIICPDFTDNKMFVSLQKKKGIEINSLLSEMCITSSEKGSIEPGKKPGLLLISGIDYSNMALKENCSLKKLI